MARRDECPRFLFLSNKEELPTAWATSNVPAMRRVLPNDDGIEEEILRFLPTHVIIESLWVNPEKFAILTHVYPNIKWIVRLKLGSSFPVDQGIGKEWVTDYKKYRNVYVKTNVL